MVVDEIERFVSLAAVYSNFDRLLVAAAAAAEAAELPYFPVACELEYHLELRIADE